MELCWGLDESSLVRINKRTAKGDVIVDVSLDHLTKKKKWMRPSTDRSSLTFRVSGPHKRLQSPRYILERQRSLA